MQTNKKIVNVYSIVSFIGSILLSIISLLLYFNISGNKVYNIFLNRIEFSIIILVLIGIFSVLSVIAIRSFKKYEKPLKPLAITGLIIISIIGLFFGLVLIVSILGFPIAAIFND